MEESIISPFFHRYAPVARATQPGWEIICTYSCEEIINYSVWGRRTSNDTIRKELSQLSLAPSFLSYKSVKRGYNRLGISNSLCMCCQAGGVSCFQQARGHVSHGLVMTRVTRCSSYKTLIYFSQKLWHLICDLSKFLMLDFLHSYGCLTVGQVFMLDIPKVTQPPISLHGTNACRGLMFYIQWVGMPLVYLLSNMQLR